MYPVKVVRSRKNVSIKQAHKLIKKFQSSLTATTTSKSGHKVDELVGKLSVVEAVLASTLHDKGDKEENHPVAAVVESSKSSSGGEKKSKKRKHAEVK